MMVVVAVGLGQIVSVGELAGLGGGGEILRKLVELVGGGGVTLRLGGLRSALQIGSDLLRDLLILGWIRLLQLVERVHQLRERREIAVVRCL